MTVTRAHYRITKSVDSPFNIFLNENGVVVSSEGISRCDLSFQEDGERDVVLSSSVEPTWFDLEYAAVYEGVSTKAVRVNLKDAVIDPGRYEVDVFVFDANSPSGRYAGTIDVLVDGPLSAPLGALPVDLFGNIRFPTLTPAQLTADVDDYAPGSEAFWRLSSDDTRTITGIDFLASGVFRQIVNIGVNNIILSNQSIESDAENRIITIDGKDRILEPNDFVFLMYDGDSNRWREARHKGKPYYIRTPTEDSASSVIVDYSKFPGEVVRYGDAGEVALQVAISAVGAGGTVIVSPGLYEKVDISSDDRTFIIERGAIFTIPDNDITAVDTSGTPALEISGNNVAIEGRIECDGNKANQDTSGFSADERSATFKVSGDDFVLDGTVEILNAYWDGFTIDGGDTSGQEVLRSIIFKMKVKDPYNRSGTFWGAIGFNVDHIDVESETMASGDHRVRFGTNSGATSVTKGYVGYIHAPGQFVVIEENTELLQLPDVQAAAMKSEAANNIQGGRAELRDLDDGVNLSFGVLGGIGNFWDTVSVVNHAGSAAAAVSFEADFADVYISKLRVKDSVNTAGGCRVRAGVGLYVELGDFADNADFGLHVDESGAWTQSDFWFNTILAGGNGGTDVNFESGIDNSGYGYLARKAGGTYAGLALVRDSVDPYNKSEVATGAFTASLYHLKTAIDSSGGAVAVTLPDGLYEGQRKVITMTDATASSTVSVTSHETTDPEVFTFAETTDYLVLEWNATGAYWWTVKNIGAAT